jgi:signal transduction histidine kinase
MAFVEVSDTGLGIAPEDLPHVFERYYRGRSAARSKGTGLGLAIVRAVIEAHKGSVTVESSEGEGTTFTLSLPAAKD